MHANQIVGAPAWADSEKFDIEAKPDRPGMPTINQMKGMLRKLLLERFSIASTWTKRIVRLCHHNREERRENKEEILKLPLPGFGGQPQRGFSVRNATLAEFASMLQAQFMDLPVVDRTDLGDTRYTFVMKFTPDPGMRPFGGAGGPPEGQAVATDPDAPPDLFSAMEQQLGLRLQKTKTPVDVMIIDKVAKPSPN